MYSSCSDALLRNNKVSNYYIIQIEENSVESKVECLMVNDTHFEIIIDSDKNYPNIVNSTQFENNYSYQKYVNYPNFTDSEMDKILQETLVCSQEASFKSYYSALESNMLEFWDGYKIEYNNNTDGICKCFMREACIISGESVTKCKQEVSSYDPYFNYTGEFSVFPKRLPLRKLYLGDTGHSYEAIEYSIGKLKCLGRFKENNSILYANLSPYRSCAFFASYLYDNSNSTCVTIIGSNNHITAKGNEVINSLEILGKNISCLEMIVSIPINGNNNIICPIKEGKESDECTFKCDYNFTTDVFIHFTSMKEFKICEIRGKFLETVEE
ncbi:unnamed protein product [Dimorphilus gyrociliatus]|uniref:Uncharacterized protein n=1 Tax=Dimorphilus gyrociliatus TaxID=2664684 RepID=A0A7I8VC92_9ANNE|nr:unnamed protein product [Dimorphilus gyrociliatus]